MNSSSAIAGTLPSAAPRRRPAPPQAGHRGVPGGLGDAGADQPGEADAQHDRGDPLPAQRLDHRVGGVPADEHEHEEEEDHDRAGVDDDLHRAQERRLLDDVEDAQREHRVDQPQRGVDGVLRQHHAQRPGQRDRPEHPEDDGLAGADLHTVSAAAASTLTPAPPSTGSAARRGAPPSGRARSSPSRRPRAASGAAAAPSRAAAGPSAAPWCRSAPAGRRRRARSRCSSSATASGRPRCTARRRCSAGS